MQTGSKRATTKVRVCFTVEIDIEAYKLAYGSESIRAIQDDTRWAMYHTAIQATFSAPERIVASSQLETARK